MSFSYFLLLFILGAWQISLALYHTPSRVIPNAQPYEDEAPRRTVTREAVINSTVTVTVPVPAPATATNISTNSTVKNSNSTSIPINKTTEKTSKKTFLMTSTTSKRSIPTRNMKVHYYEMWNHSTSTIEVPEIYKNPFDLPLDDEHGNPRRLPLTSLEILHQVLHGEKYKAEFKAVEEYMKKIKKQDDHTGIQLPSCLAPDIGATRKLADEVVKKRSKKPNEYKWQLPLPILNLGYPKVGSTTLEDFFNCIGMKANHNQEGSSMFERVAEGKSVFKKHKSMPQAFCQLDENSHEGYYPQISLLDEMHAAYPNSTFVMNFRPISDWIRSMQRWRQMPSRMSRFLVPGLVLTQDQAQNVQAYWQAHRRNETKKRLPRISNTQLAKWWCGHVLHLREYITEYPSHALIELDLYSNTTNAVMYDLFQADAKNGVKGVQCWGKSNVNSKFENTTRPKKPI